MTRPRVDQISARLHSEQPKARREGLYRIVTILLIGFLTLFSAPRAGMAHVAAMAMHPLGLCPDCPDRMSVSGAIDSLYPHGVSASRSHPIIAVTTASAALSTLSAILHPPPVANILAHIPARALPSPYRVRPHLNPFCGAQSSRFDTEKL